MNGFDDIINNLDSWLDRDKAVISPKTASMLGGPPRFNPGDVVRIKETRWHPQADTKDSKRLVRTGVYTNPGYPKLQDLELQSSEKNSDWRWNPELKARLMECLAGVVSVGETCRVLACHFEVDDSRWYYFIDNGKERGKGWTRCDFRFEAT